MRKHQQHQILNLLQTIKRAQSLHLYADCRESAAGIGEFIDSVEGNGTQTAKLLAEYCELLSQAGNSMIGKQQLQKYLSLIENSVNYELKPPDKIEVVFFPYNASMFDSMESIYLAAKNDPQCDAYVVPIPYYNLLPDGKFGQMHYEGDLYPDNIPITDWREYDVEVRNPDIIFIHTPYDKDNLVTSIHPDFYSKRLRNFTGLLVYVPYFVGLDDVPEWLCVHSGTVYADKIIVQSEKVRQTYIRVFKEFGRENNCEKLFGNLEDKIVALGSPKFDKVLNTKREDCHLPDNWRTLINRTDGTRKKVILYNTSLSEILQGNESYLKKLKSVLALFRERDNVVLWWRPHPLSKNTYQAMRPNLCKEYERIVWEYRYEDWGIYDDSPDLHRAIAVSDGYFGDGGSLLALYKITGKPLMIQHMDYTEYYDTEQKHEQLHSDVIHFGMRLIAIDEFKRMYPEHYEYWLPRRNIKQTSRFVILMDYEYGVSSFINAIYKLDEENAKAKCIKNFPSDDVNAGMYHAPIRIGNKMLFIPVRSREWAFYDMKTDEWTHEPVPEEYYPSKAWRAVFNGPIIYGDDIIFFPGESGAIAKYNIDTGKISYHREWYSTLSYDIKNVDWGIISVIFVYNESILLGSPQSNTITELNPKTMRVTNTYRVGNDKCGIKSAVLIPHTDTVYLIKYRKPGQKPWTETIIKWNIKTGVIKEFTDLPINLTADKTQNALSHFIFWREILYLFPLQGDAVLKLDPKTDEITRLTLTPEFDFFKRKSHFYNGWAKDLALPYVIFNGKRLKCLAQLPYDYSLADIDFETGEISKRRKWYVEGVEDLFRQKGKTPTDDVLYENTHYTLDAFIDDLSADRPTRILEKQNSISQNIHTDETSGKKIYEYAKKSVGI